MDLNIFKKQLTDIKQAKVEAEEKLKHEYDDAFETACKEVAGLVENLKPYIEHATKEFNLSDQVKEIENTVAYAYTASIRWNKNLDEAHFSYCGSGTSFSFSLKNLINKNTMFGKHQLMLIKTSFNSKNVENFVENLLKRLETNSIYICSQY